MISNAVKFCEHGVGEIQIASRVLNSQLLINVTDNGSGIDEDSLPYIFDKFYQAKNQSLRKAKGTGLGLAITKKIIQLHGGTIQVESKIGHGTTFLIKMPALLV